MLCDGLIVPIFADESGGRNVVRQLGGSMGKVAVSKIGNPLQAMRKAAQQGAAGFQLDRGIGEGEADLLASTQGRILFPFMVRREEAGALWPTVLGSASNCDAGAYLTRRGVVQFGPHDLKQWVRWDVMDRASAVMAVNQPFRSHEPGDPFWALRFESGELCLFANDHVLREYTPPEGYYPVFTSVDGATEFLKRGLGGPWSVQTGFPDPNRAGRVEDHATFPKRTADLIPLIAEIRDLGSWLQRVRDQHQMPPWSKFVINPVGHREDIAWGSFENLDPDRVRIKAVSGRWTLFPGHTYQLEDRVDQFTAEDTFYRGVLDFQFSELGRSFATGVTEVAGEDLMALSDAELEDWLLHYLVETPEQDGGDPSEDEWDSGGQDAEEAATAEESHARLRRWHLDFWETVGGERVGPFVFENPTDMAKMISHLERDDASARATGRHGCTSVGFSGSGSLDLERSGSRGLQRTLVRICTRIVRNGYRPQDAIDMAAAANAIFRNYRITVCGVAADLITSHVPTEARSTEDLYESLELPPELHEVFLESLEHSPDPAADQLLVSRIGAALANSMLPRTRLFMSTALLQFKSFGLSPCLDYAPVSVQVVKALEYEVRELFKEFFKTQSAPVEAIQNTREERTLVEFAQGNDKAVSLGSLTFVIRKAKQYSIGPMKDFNDFLTRSGLTDVASRKTTEFILKDVLEEFRNGGAHEHAIGHATCARCIESLIGTKDMAGLILRITRRRLGSPSQWLE
jgi:hypothetical protein